MDEIVKKPKKSRETEFEQQLSGSLKKLKNIFILNRPMVNRLIKDVLTPVYNDLKPVTPVDSGDLKKSLKIVIVKRKRRGIYQVRVQYHTKYAMTANYHHYAGKPPKLFINSVLDKHKLTTDFYKSWEVLINKVHEGI